jgi:hypothetical protein
MRSATSARPTSSRSDLGSTALSVRRPVRFVLGDGPPRQQAGRLGDHADSLESAGRFGGPTVDEDLAVVRCQ